MKRAAILLLLLLTGCAGARLSSDEIRKKIVEVGGSGVIPAAVEVREIVSESANELVANSTVAMAFQFRRANTSSPWEIAAVRLGDRDWISLPQLIAAINESRRVKTTNSLQALVNGIESYRTAKGSAPVASSLVELTNMLHPQYMSELVRADAWGHPITFQAAGYSYRLMSNGADEIGRAQV